MYRVYCDNFLLYSENLEQLKIFNPHVKIEQNKIGEFTFTIYANHPYYDRIQRLKSIITVYQDNYVLFNGRVINDEIGFYNEKHIVCESEMAYLLDSIQRPFSYTGTTSGLFQQLLAAHNSQVSEGQKIKAGNCNITEEITVSEQEYQNTLKVLETAIIEPLGAFASFRLETDGVYLDLLSDITLLSPQKIEFASNLLDLKRKRLGDEIVTALIPLGAKLVDAQGQETEERLTIKSVNSNLDYISNNVAVAQYGFIVKSVIFDDITDASVLKTKGQAHLSNLVNLTESIELSAADLATVDEIESFHVGTKVRVTSEPHAIDQLFIVSKIEINLLDPAANRLTLGKTISTFTESAIGIKGDAGRQGIQGIKGDTGSAGNGVASIIEEYYLSTSKTSQSGGSWVTTAPTWTTGKYMWTRSKITYTNGTVAYTTALCDSSWEAVNEIEIGGRNLYEKSAELSRQSFSIYQGAYTFEVEANLFSNGCNIVSATYNTAPTSGGVYLSGTNLYFGKYIPKMNVGEWYTVSVWVKCSVDLNIGIMRAEFLNNTVTTAPNLSTQWQLYTTSGIYNGNTIESVAISFYYGSAIPVGEKIFITSPKVEHGNKATDWTPAPEDVEAEIGQNVKTVDIWYYLSTSETALAGGTWTTTAPAWVNGRYFWQKTITTLANGIVRESTPMCITGTKNTAVQSTTAPTDTSFMWLDISSEPAVLKRYNAGQWEIVSDTEALADTVVLLEQRLNTEISQTTNEILLQASEEYYLKSDADVLQSKMETEYRQTNDEFSFRFNEFSADLAALSSGTAAQFQEVSRYIRFIDGNIILGEEDNPLILKIENDRIAFLQENAEVAYFSNNKLFVTDGHFINSLQIGDFQFIPRTNGNLSFKKVTATDTANITGFALVGQAVAG